MNSENQVLAALQREFPRKEFIRGKRLRVGDTISGVDASKGFDVVSKDSKIVAMVKDYTATNVNGNYTRHARVIRDLYYLCLVNAEQKFMYLSKDYYEWFARQSDAVIACGIKMRLIPEDVSV